MGELWKTHEAESLRQWMGPPLAQANIGMWRVTLINPHLFGFCHPSSIQGLLKFTALCKDFQIFEQREALGAAMSWWNFTLDSSTAQIFQPSHSTPAKSPVFQGTLTGKCGQSDFSAVQPLLYLKHCSEKKKPRGFLDLESSICHHLTPFFEELSFSLLFYIKSIFSRFYHTRTPLFCQSLIKNLPELIHTQS